MSFLVERETVNEEEVSEAFAHEQTKAKCATKDASSAPTFLVEVLARVSSGHTPKRSSSPTGRSKHLLETHLRTPSENPFPFKTH